MLSSSDSPDSEVFSLQVLSLKPKNQVKTFKIIYLDPSFTSSSHWVAINLSHNKEIFILTVTDVVCHMLNFKNS